MKHKHINNLSTFAKACKNLSSEQIYELFESVIENPLRAEILNVADTNTPEPVRCALNKIGTYYEVPSLIKY